MRRYWRDTGRGSRAGALGPAVILLAAWSLAPAPDRAAHRPAVAGILARAVRRFGVPTGVPRWCRGA